MQNVLQLELGDGKLWMHLLSAAAAISSESDLSVPSHYSLSPNLTYIQHTRIPEPYLRESRLHWGCFQHTKFQPDIKWTYIARGMVN